MRSNEYLYGKDVEVPEIDPLVVVRRIELLKDNLSELLEHSFYTRDGARCNKIIKAIKHYENINKENEL